MSDLAPDPLPLRTITMPPEVSAVTGCDCGGVEWHRAGTLGNTACSIWSQPEAERLVAVDAALDRKRAFTAALNARLRACLP
jgi:hypothetical protein